MKDPRSSVPSEVESGWVFSWFLRLGVVYLVVALLAGAFDVSYILRHHVRYPFGDQWIWLARLYERGFWCGFTSQYNEHRLIVPGVFYYADYRYFGSRNTLLAIVSLLFQLGCGALLIVPLWRSTEVWKPLRCFFAGFVAMTVLWFIQAEDLFYPYQLQISCANFGILAAMHLFARLASRRKERVGRLAGLWVAVFACAFWATFSFGHGILIWPVLLALGMAARFSKRELLMIAAVFACAASLYFIQYQKPAGSASPLESLRQPSRVVQYAVLLIGLPLFGAGAPDVSVMSHAGLYATAATGVVLALLMLARFALAKPGERQAFEYIYCAMLATNLGAAVLAALSRGNFPLEQALSGRYAPMPLIFWISLIALTTIHLCRAEARGGVGRVMWCGLLAAASAVMLPAQFTMGHYMAYRARNQAAAALSMAVGTPDAPRIREEMAPPALVAFVDRNGVRLLGHSLFADAGLQWLGSRVTDHFQPAGGGACLGAVDSLNPVAGSTTPGVRLAGWAWDVRGHRAARRVWVTDAEGMIRGLGQTGEERPDVAGAYKDKAMAESGWVAYSRTPVPGTPFTVLAEVGDGRSVCPIGQRAAGN